MVWLTGWSKRKKITLTGGSSGAQTDYQLKLTVTYDSDMQADFDDLRFTKADGTLIDAWLESKVDDTSATVWAEFPTTPANTVEQTYYMYYGNVGASSDWDGGETFQFFDNFEVGVCSGTPVGWTNESGASITKISSPIKNGLCAADSVISTSWKDSYKNVGTNLQDMVFEYYARVPQTNLHKGIALDITNGGHVNCVYVLFNNDGYISYHSGSGYVQLRTYSVDTWYRFKITTHPSTNTFDIDIDGVNEGIGLASRADYSNGVNYFDMSGIAGGHQYIDMIFARKYAANPPTYGFGSEESAPSGNSCWYWQLLKRRN